MEFLNTQTPIAEILLRMTAAIGFGAIVGLDREAQNKPAGLRTHMLISLASAVFTLLTFELTKTAVAIDDTIRADPVRLTEAVVTGVAFLGAGTIIQARGRIEGITTGASIWLAGAIGAACGGGYFVIAGCALLFAVLVLTVVGLVEFRFKARREEKS